MNNLFKYIKKYKDITFKQKAPTEVDILIFSQIPYLDYTSIFAEQKEELKLSTLWKKVKKLELKPIGIAAKKTYPIMEALSTAPRYKDLLLTNYIYHLADDTQFGAITIKIPNYDCLYIAFEGTDDTLCGWKEDFKLSYHFPTTSQVLAGKYLNDVIKIFGPEVIVCGHSKGGNLALVGAMNTSIFKKNRIKRIYSFDGPGLKDEEFASVKYRLVRNKLINIIPNGSLVGVLLTQEHTTVIKSKGLGIFQHLPTTWIVDDDKLELTTQDDLSKKLDIYISRWLEKHNYEEREQIIEGVFSVFENADIKKLSDIKISRLESIYKIVKSTQNMSTETRNVIRTSIKLLATDFQSELKKYPDKLKNNLENILDGIQK